MQFMRDMAEKVLSGEKTQTRRPLKYSYEAGREYAVQCGRGKPAVGRIRIVKVQRVSVEPISRSDALAEGFATPRDFYDRWNQMYGHLLGECWKLTFELVKGGADE